MTEQPTPDDSYPVNWRPREARERDEQLTEFEMIVRAMDDTEWQDFSRRVRGDR